MYNVPAQILQSVTTKINGVNTKAFIDSDIIYVSAKSYGGTEKIVNGLYVIEDTLQIETWYRPDITGDCKIRLLDDNSEWSILNTPENMNRENKILRFKCKRCKGGV